MSTRSRSRGSEKAKRAARKHASLFAALGEETRLALLFALAASAPLSITRLTEGSDLSRQAITKHLLVLEEAGLIERLRAGRETLFRPRPESLIEATKYLQAMSQEWDGALARLKTLVEE